MSTGYPAHRRSPLRRSVDAVGIARIHAEGVFPRVVVPACSQGMVETRASLVTQLLREGRAVFLAARPDPVLVCIDDPASDGGESGFETISVARVDLAAIREAADVLGTVPVRGAARDLYVVKKRPDAPFEDRIGVGRARNADVSLPASTVSKYHAYFARDPDSGAWTLTDAGSTNGTFVGDERLPPRSTARVEDGQRVGFGRSRFVFHTPEGFVDWLEGVR